MRFQRSTCEYRLGMAGKVHRIPEIRQISQDFQNTRLSCYRCGLPHSEISNISNIPGPKSSNMLLTRSGSGEGRRSKRAGQQLGNAKSPKKKTPSNASPGMIR